MVYSLGRIYCSAPTQTAVDKFASRLQQIASAVAARCSASRPVGNQVRKPLIVRPHAISDELFAFKHLLQHPQDIDGAVKTTDYAVSSDSNLHLSLAFWVLVALRSKATERFDVGAMPDALGWFYDSTHSNPGLWRIRDMATGFMDWAQYCEGEMVPDDRIVSAMQSVLRSADVVCATPAMSLLHNIAEWKKRSTGVAVDEASIVKDLSTIWTKGLPCLLAGDEYQPSADFEDIPNIFGNDTQRVGDHPLCPGPNGNVLPFMFFKATGWPIYRLRTQLRMAEGLFDLCHSEVYNEIPLVYGPRSDIGLPHHKIGRDLEAFLKGRFPDISPAPDGSLQPVFVHCKGSFCNRQTYESLDQVKIALDLARDFVSCQAVDPRQIIIMSTSLANVGLVSRHRASPEYASLADMPPASMFEPGRQGDIVFLVMGTSKTSGPGFTTNQQRLNVMLSRHRCGLVVFGDINVAGPVDGTGTTRAKTLGKRAKKEDHYTFSVVGEDGKKHWMKAGMLHNVYKALYKAGRVVTVGVGRPQPEGHSGLDIE